MAALLIVFFGFKNNAKADSSYDLKAESLTMDSAKCEVNKVCAFTAKVKNLGSEFNFDFPLKSSVASANYKTDSPTGISPSRGIIIKTNDYITFYLSGVYSKIGSVTLTFSVDPAGYLTESDTGNNSISLTVDIAGYDLAVEAITISPANPIVNQACHVQIKVKNNSSYNLYTETGLNLVRSFPDFSVSQASSTAPSFANVIHTGGYLYWGYEGKFTSSGEKQFSFTVDPDDALKESDLANNITTKKITVYNAADTDLAINSVSYSVDKIILGMPLDITIGVKNIGKTSLTDASGLVKSQFSYNLPYFEYGVNDLIIDAYPTFSTPLNPAGIFRYKFHGAFTRTGNFDLTFSINKDKQLVESNFNNNTSTTTVVVYKDQAEADAFSILSKNVSLVSSTTAIISWTTDINTTGILNYNQVPDLMSENRIEDNNSKIAHTITLNNLRPGVNYNYSLIAKNGIVEKTEMMNSFSMPANDTLTAVSGTNVGFSEKDASFSWVTNLTSSGHVYYKKHGAISVSVAGSNTAAAEHKIEIKDLAIGLYDYFLSSTSTPKTNFKTSWASFEIKSASSAPIASITTVNNPAPNTAASFVVTNDSLYEKLKGKIVLKVQDKGQAYYISPSEKKMYYLGRPADAFQVIRNQGVGIINGSLDKIPVNLNILSGTDSDNDGLPDAFEEAMGTNKNQADTDNDGHSEKEELSLGYSPLKKNKKLGFDNALIAKLKGKILLQVEHKGEAWYVNPADGKRYFLSRPADAFNLMRQLGVGVNNSDYGALGGK